jgi:hypothetical protein
VVWNQYFLPMARPVPRGSTFANPKAPKPQKPPAAGPRRPHPRLAPAQARAGSRSTTMLCRRRRNPRRHETLRRPAIRASSTARTRCQRDGLLACPSRPLRRVAEDDGETWGGEAKVHEVFRRPVSSACTVAWRTMTMPYCSTRPSRI